ncbi:MAG TPA: YigZ family protein [Rectinemataceae bacterium]
MLNSRFIACLDYADTVDSARSFIQAIREEYPDATHHVPAYIIGGGSARTEYCSDNGEPSGTAGKPLLAVLRGSGLGDAAIVVVRYFGGTLLGTGGLVKAYAEAGKAVLAAAEPAIVRSVAMLELEAPYRLHEQVGLLCSECGGKVLESRFSEAVSMVFEIPEEREAEFNVRLSALSGGTLSVRRFGLRLARDRAARSR